MQKKRIDFIKDKFDNTWNWAIKNNILILSDKNSYVDNIHKIMPNPAITKELAFDTLCLCDPTKNKEYLDWLRCLYKNNLKQYKSFKRGYPNKFNELFWEDIQSNIYSSLELHFLLKKTKVLDIQYRDIFKFKTMGEFVRFMHKFKFMGDSIEDAEVDTLDSREIAAIANYYNITQNHQENNGRGCAEILYDNDKWLIVNTHDYKANKEFGKYTTWCTAGTKYAFAINGTTSAFENYRGRGFLFVLIKRGCVSHSILQKHPQNRLQFHFQDGFFMNAQDKPIDIHKFMLDNPDIRDFFKSYVVNTVMPYRSVCAASDNIEFLLKLGYEKEIIEILIKSKPNKLKLTSLQLSDDVFTRLGEVTSLEEIDLTNNNLQQIPESFKKLRKLKRLLLRHNKIRKLPDWIFGLPSLRILDVTDCNLSNVNINNKSNINELYLDFNKNLAKISDNFDLTPNLNKLSISNCSLNQIPDSIVSCTNLYILDAHSNPKLKSIPPQISTLPNIIAIILDNTQIADETINLMHQTKTRNVTIIKYNKN